MFYKKFIINKIKKRKLFDFLDSFDTEPINDERSQKVISPSTNVENKKVYCVDSLDEDHDNEIKYIFDNISDISDKDSDFEQELISTETNNLNLCKKDK